MASHCIEMPEEAPLSTSQWLHPELRSALDLCVSSLRRVASSDLGLGLERRLSALQERKEFLSDDEHQELLAMVRFAEARAVERLEAELALRRLREVAPDLMDDGG